ncbi:hypothetical protein O7606_06750 [Micromonospora sp. WMMD882]|uniref:hypothetical protein n=1 Tax=Micromonospora sp. WMMD882 TaxID=3015151 RepID=UPI00248C1981|nr:hypothetical protein [Micromonospora sp. WMMD882]WBB81075.1 hypothetical protein O7606_06750 [Micromonospora sp. WMMD882]
MPTVQNGQATGRVSSAVPANESPGAMLRPCSRATRCGATATSRLPPKAIVADRGDRGDPAALPALVGPTDEGGRRDEGREQPHPVGHRRHGQARRQQSIDDLVRHPGRSHVGLAVGHHEDPVLVPPDGEGGAEQVGGGPVDQPGR